MDLDLNISKKYYYDEIQEISPKILENISKSSLHGKYRAYLSEFRNIEKRVLDESFMFYTLDGYEEIDEIFDYDYEKGVTGFQTGEYVKNKERFIFPILDQNKVIAGWVGYDYESNYKYLLSFSKFSEKSRLFYNLQNIEKSYEKDVCIVEEGIIDSLRLNEKGYYNNLALLGKRMTEDQIRVLNRFSLVIIIPDNDIVGEQSLKYWLKGLKTKVAVIRLNKTEYNIKKEGLEDNESVKTVKDIDDLLRPEVNKEKEFKLLYNKILKDSKSPFFKIKEYFI